MNTLFLGYNQNKKKYNFAANIYGIAHKIIYDYSTYNGRSQNAYRRASHSDK